MKKYLMSIVKYCKPIYRVYYYTGTFFLNLLKKFIRTEENLILFVSFGGKKFDDSPRAIYEGMLKDKRFEKYDLVWAFQTPENFSIPRGRIIKVDTFNYFVTALRARCWITNSSIERGLGFTGKHTFFYNTWHGTPIKKMGTDIGEDNASFRSKNTWNMDVLTCQSQYEAEIFSRVFEIDLKKCVKCGLPRNDVLAFVTEEQKKEMKAKLGIPNEKKVILYAPTFREYEKNEALKCVFKSPICFRNWKKELEEEWVILLRVHYEALQSMDLEGLSGFVYDVSAYSTLNDLMIASDILISDYSSIFFDYAILGQPMLCYAYDYDEYTKKRGLYFDIRKELLGGTIAEEELLELVKTMPSKEAIESTRSFKNKYVESYGKATETSLNLIYERIK